MPPQELQQLNIRLRLRLRQRTRARAAAREKVTFYYNKIVTFTLKVIIRDIFVSYLEQKKGRECARYGYWGWTQSFADLSKGLIPAPRNINVVL